MFIASRDAFGGFTFAAFSAKNSAVFVAVIITPSLIETSTFFFQSKLLTYLYRILSSCDQMLKHMTSVFFGY